MNLMTIDQNTPTDGRRVNQRQALVVILALSDLSRDPRVMRQILWLKKNYRVVAAGFAPPQDDSVEFLSIGPTGVSGSQGADLSVFLHLRNAIAKIPFARFLWRKLKRPLAIRRSALRSRDGVVREDHAAYYRSKLSAMCDCASLAGLSPDLILANDLDCLVLADLVFRGVRVVFDAHEYAPLEYASQDDFWVMQEQPARVWACRSLLPRVSGMSTVCSGIAQEFERNFEIPSGIKVITNAPLYESIAPRATGPKTRIVHHGIGAPIRKIELMAETVKILGPEYELYLILVEGDAKYIESLKSTYGPCGNIHFLQPVPMPDIAKFISRFDIGLFILEPDIFNYQWALPNKFFEFIQARLAIAVGPSPEMSRIVRDYGLGVVAPDFLPASMARALISLGPQDIDRFKANSDRCASLFCAEANEREMLGIMERALTGESVRSEA